MSRKLGGGLLAGCLYFYVHFVVEVLCFFVLHSIVGDSWILWFAPFIYDLLAFVPQLLIGQLSDKFARIPFGLIGMAMLAFGLCLFWLNIANSVILAVVIIALGNACVHVNGAEVTLRSSNGKISPAAIFVSGGSFGVVTGKLLAGKIPLAPLLILALSAVVAIVYAERYRIEADKKEVPCEGFKFANEKLPVMLVTILATLVVAVRGYVGYGIPTAWNKTALQTIMLFSFMGVGKALGGILTDKIGIRKTAIISMLGAIPFLIFGDQLMAVSLIGVMFFSMTMAITLAILVSVYKDSPGIAFGCTTIGLAVGSLPVFVIRFSMLVNCVLIVISSLLCLLILLKLTRKEKKNV